MASTCLSMYCFLQGNVKPHIANSLCELLVLTDGGTGPLPTTLS